MQNSKDSNSKDRPLKELSKLLEEFGELSRLKFFNQKVNEEFFTALKTLQSSIAALRVVVKYQQFDLEATRRENVALRKQLQQYEED